MEACNACSASERSTTARRRRSSVSARQYTILRKEVLDFSFLAASSATTVTLRRALWLGEFHFLWYGVRIHNLAIDSGSFVLDAYHTLPNRDDPAEFTQSTQLLPLTVNTADAAPKLEFATENKFGPYLKFQLTATQGAGGGRLYAELSSVLLARAI